ncbi:hypothetical protein EVAR_51936_1 [Eumeta japonica]|uniref:Replicase polyprotein 1a n=1 Tax=Eumeta variegata TaxID=151549 RepID=A0A4C1YLS9_EUMVA|nr:hypothetical protein EVAR_51936_1 [Eumeta japonica]
MQATREKVVTIGRGHLQLQRSHQRVAVLLVRNGISDGGQCSFRLERELRDKTGVFITMLQGRNPFIISLSNEGLELEALHTGPVRLEAVDRRCQQRDDDGDNYNSDNDDGDNGDGDNDDGDNDDGDNDDGDNDDGDNDDGDNDDGDNDDGDNDDGDNDDGDNDDGDNDDGDNDDGDNDGDNDGSITNDGNNVVNNNNGSCNNAQQ